MSEEHKSKKSDTLTISKVTLWKSISGILGIFLLISIFTGGFGLNQESTSPDMVVEEAQAIQPKEQPSVQKLSAGLSALVEDDAIKGDPEAKVTIIEWSDFECPFCARFYSQGYQQLVSTYIDTGKVNLVFRDFPLNFHRNAQKAAEAAECAGEQGKYYDMHDLLFEKGVSGGVSSFKKYAEDLELNTEEFNTCLDSGKFASDAKKDMSDGGAAGITGTPGFIIYTSNDVDVLDIQNAIAPQYSRNIEARTFDGGVGAKVSGALPFDAFEDIIEVMLAE